MIGRKLKGVRHLLRVAESLGKVQFFFTTNGMDINMATAMFIPAKVAQNRYISSGNGKDWMIIFNNLMHNTRAYTDDFKGTEIEKDVERLMGIYGHMYVVSVNGRYRDHSQRFLDIVALPEDFDKQYSDFCAANKKQVDQAIQCYYGSKDSHIAKYMFALTDGSKNFYTWATQAVFKHGHNIRTIEKVMMWNNLYGKMSKNLAKGSITAYTGNRESLCRGLLNELHFIRREKRANDVINTFNTAQKKALKAYKLTDRDYDTLSRFAKLSFKKKSNFIKKMSSVDDVKEILHQMSFLADIQFEWKKDSFVEYLKNNENLSYEVILDKGDIMLIKVNDYETIKRLTKATNWCISKDKKYWNDYVESHSDSDQYVIFDFSRREDDNMSIVGFTCNKKRGITNSHDFNNRNLMNGRRGNNVVNEIKSFALKHIDTNSIYSVLDRNGIDLSILLPGEPIEFEWTRDGIFERINLCIDEYDYYILADYGDRIVVMVEDSDIKYLLGDKFMDSINSMGNNNDYIIFFDLTKDKKNANKIIYGAIRYDHKKNEANVSRLYNSNSDQISVSFDHMLDEWGLPYDVICRNDDIVERFFSAFGNLELATCQELIKNDEVRKGITSGDYANSISTMLESTIFNNYSMDYVNLFYNNGLKIFNIIPYNHLSLRLIENIYNLYRNDVNCRIRPIPTNDEIKELFEDNHMDNSRSIYVGFYLILISMIKHEGFNRPMFDDLQHFIAGKSDYCQMYDKVFIAMLETIEFKGREETNFARNIMNLAYKRGGFDVINFIAEMKPNTTNSDILSIVSLCQERAKSLKEAQKRSEELAKKMRDAASKQNTGTNATAATISVDGDDFWRNAATFTTTVFTTSNR